jgi:hypothetical protein
MSWCFRRGAVENSVLLGYDSAPIGNRIPTFRSKAMDSFSRVSLHRLESNYPLVKSQSNGILKAVAIQGVFLDPEDCNRKFDMSVTIRELAKCAGVEVLKYRKITQSASP